VKILRWTGGKSRLVGQILKIMPAHRVYVEPFAGSAAVFFAKPLAEVNVLNDTNELLIEFYRKFRELESINEVLQYGWKPDRG